KRFSTHTKIFAFTKALYRHNTFAPALTKTTCKSYAKAAFTLAETLITLAIIGVVAAMTIPAVLNHTKETQMKTGLKKAQSILSEALQLMQEEEGIIANFANYPFRAFFPVFKTYFSNLKDCSNSECSYLTGSTVGNQYYTYNGSTNAYAYYFDDGQLILADGMFLMVEDPNAVKGTIFLSIDINGLDKKPNKWGHDLFTFQIDEQTGKLLPMGHPDTDFTDESTYCSKTSSNTKNGIACTYKALTEKDYFKNLP
ncbi:MAG: type II secretion system GspH family protein, partial [Candidatus Gastranaerophilales bacterium]|nr:type II secretion system GspH family protein [Candidatus Gastranaerophilales bacterium]